MQNIINSKTITETTIRRVLNVLGSKRLYIDTAIFDFDKLLITVVMPICFFVLLLC
jgi:hypothetical protein